MIAAVSITVGLFAIALIVAGSIAFYAFLWTNGAPFLPSRRHAVESMILLVNPQPGDRCIDIGSGSGHIVRAFACRGVETHGIELNPVLVAWSRLQIALAGLGSRAVIHYGNLWDHDYSSYSVVMIYGLPAMLSRLEKKLEAELCPGARVISNTFRFPTWKPNQIMGTVYLYCVGEHSL